MACSMTAASIVAAPGTVHLYGPAMKMLRSALVIAALLLLAGACGSDEPQPPRITARSSFDATPHSERVFESYRQTGDYSRDITLPEGSQKIVVRMDCAGAEGHLDVTFSTAGGASGECTPTASGRPGFVALTADGSLIGRHQTMRITGPNSQQWSVAVDAGATVPPDQ
jgi:hypothetical protein